ncbi:T9SS C-terminal target domain-containing protein [Bacteroidetes/Chlorobi group bacterium Naka2016]|nr:MAG: T9SS C-terminal target domain-containing protein [Bacteroidetes/Chlorobi group bacterium Naka2016]
MEGVMKKSYTLFQLILSFILFFVMPDSLNSQTKVWEKVYEDPLLESFLAYELFLSSDGNSIYGIGNGVVGDTTFLFVSKYNLNGDLLFYKRHFKTLNNKIKRIFLYTSELERNEVNEIIRIFSFIPIYGSLEYYVGFWAYVTKFDANGNLIFEGLDTASKHTIVYYPGSVVEMNNLYYNFTLYKDTVLLKVFALDGSFVTEKKLGKLIIPPDKLNNYFTNAIFQKKDSSIILHLVNSAPLFIHRDFSSLVKINKDFDIDWMKELIINGDTLSIISVLMNKDERLVAYCRGRDSSHHIVELDENGSILYSKRLELDNRLNVFKIKEISDGGYVLLGKLRFTKISQLDSSCAVFIKFNRNYEIEQEFRDKFGPMPWGSTYTNFLVLPDYSFLICGHYNYYPYLVKFKDVIVSVEKKEEKNNIGQIIVEDYIELNERQNYPVEIYNILGEKVMEIGSGLPIIVKNLPRGIYFLKNGQNMHKFIKY